MPLSPEEIRSKDFLIALRGYDKHEVETFLHTVASELSQMMEELVLARTEGGQAPANNADAFSDLGDQVANIMRTAADSAAQLRSETEQQAAAIRASALEEAGHAAAEARLELDAASRLRAEAEQQAEQLRASQQEVAGIKNEARSELESAIELRASVESEATELRESATRQAQELRAEAERTAAQLLDSAKQDIEQAMAQVLQGCERLRLAQQSPLFIPDDGYLSTGPDGLGPEDAVPQISPSEETDARTG
ncbi:MAG: DivIVA domain-containing protein [Acidimicrobiales bacterium]